MQSFPNTQHENALKHGAVVGGGHWHINTLPVPWAMLKGMIYLAGAMGPWVGGWDEWRYVKPFFYDAGASYDADQASLDWVEVLSDECHHNQSRRRRHRRGRMVAREYPTRDYREHSSPRSLPPVWTNQSPAIESAEFMVQRAGAVEVDRNYKSFEENKEESRQEMARLEAEGHLERIGCWNHVRRRWKGAIATKVATLVKQKSDGTQKVRFIVDMLRSGVNSLAVAGERIVLPRATDLINFTLDLWEAARPGEFLEFLTIDIADAFLNLQIKEGERANTIIRAQDGDYLVYKGVPFGLATAPLLWGRVAAWLGRATQSIFERARVRTQIYVDAGLGGARIPRCPALVPRQSNPPVGRTWGTISSQESITGHKSHVDRGPVRGTTARHQSRDRPAEGSEASRSYGLRECRERISEPPLANGGIILGRGPGSEDQTLGHNAVGGVPRSGPATPCRIARAQQSQTTATQHGIHQHGGPTARVVDCIPPGLSWGSGKGPVGLRQSLPTQPADQNRRLHNRYGGCSVRIRGGTSCVLDLPPGPRNVFSTGCRSGRAAPHDHLRASCAAYQPGGVGQAALPETPGCGSRAWLRVGASDCQQAV